MKRIFIYGDSNVWGDNFAGPRVPYRSRWVNRLRRSLRGECQITVDGVCGRVAGDCRPTKPECNGKTSFEKALKKAGDVDIVIIALGTNDLQVRFNQSADDIIDNLLWYGDIVGGVDLIYILPPNFSDADDSGPEFTVQSQTLRNQILENKVKFVNNIVVDDLELSDGIHFSENGHKIMSKIVCDKLKELL